MVGRQIRKFVTVSESRRCLSEERDLGQRGMVGGLGSPQAALDFTLDFGGCRIQAFCSLEQLKPLAAIPATIIEV